VLTATAAQRKPMSLIQRFFQPDWEVEHVCQLEPTVLAACGIRGLLLDVDCTLMPHGQWDVAPDVRSWLEALQATGMALCLVTNARRRRSEHISELLSLPCVSRAAKPLPWRTRRALEELGVPPEQVALVGDQIFTDVLVGKLLGIRTILVKPQPGRQALSTWIKRPAERLLRLFFDGPLKSPGAEAPCGTGQSQKTSARTGPQDEHPLSVVSDPPSPGTSRLR